MAEGIRKALFCLTCLLPASAVCEPTSEPAPVPTASVLMRSSSPFHPNRDNDATLQLADAAVADSSREARPVSDFDVPRLFASTCGWCHSKGGREAGKGPQLMGTSLSDEGIVQRVKSGKPGYMPGFAGQFDDTQLSKIVTYIRELKPTQ